MTFRAENKKPILLLVNLLISVCKDKDTFENQLIKIFIETMKAGNIVLIIDNFTELYKHAESLGSDFINLIDPFVSSPAIQIIALTNNADFHRYFETNSAIMNSFETVLVRPLDLQEITQIIYSSAMMCQLVIL